MKFKKKANIVLYVVTAILSFVYFLPLYVMVVTSLKTPLEITQRRYLIPSLNLRFENFITAWNLVKKSVLNSFIITSIVTILSVIIGAFGGYFLARIRWKYNSIIFVLTAIALFIPYQVVLIPLVQITAIWGIARTYWGMIFAYILLNAPLATLLMGTFFFSIPKELEESAMVDGAGLLTTFLKVVTPVSLPSYASTAILIFTQVWNEFLIALTFSSPITTPLTVKVAEVKGSYVALYNIQMAAALIGAIIPLLIFIILGKYFITGLLAGSLKG